MAKFLVALNDNVIWRNLFAGRDIINQLHSSRLWI